MARSETFFDKIRKAIESPTVKVLELSAPALGREVLLAAVETIETQRAPLVRYDVIVRRWYLLDVPESGRPMLESLFGEEFMPGLAYLPVKSVAEAKQRIRELGVEGYPLSRFEEKKSARVGTRGSSSRQKAGVKPRAVKKKT